MLVTVVVTSIIVSCSGNPAVDRQLTVAENIMEERPDSALSVLKGIDTELVTSEAEKARYALLMSQALDKNYIDTTTFDVLQPAIDYYIDKDKGTPDEKLKTLYYQGRIYQNIPDFDMAMQTFLKANDFKNECRDSLTYAHMLVAQSVLYFSSYQIEDYVSSSLMAAELYDKLNNDRYQQSSLIKALDGSIALGNRQLSDSIMPLVDSLAQYVPDYQDERLLVKQTYLIGFESDSAIKSLLDTVSDYSMMNDESRLNIAH